MRLATIKNTSFDGQIALVSSDGSKLCDLSPYMQTSFIQFVENFEVNQSKLCKIIQQEKLDFLPIESFTLLAPLPRCYGWLDGSAFIQHVKLVRKARNAPLPETLTTVPLMYQGGSDSFLAPTQDIPLINSEWGLDFEAEVGIITKFVPQGIKACEAHKYIAFAILINDITLRELIPAELAQGFGFLQSKPSSALSPFAITLDELSDSFQEGRIHLDLETTLNDKIFGNPNAGEMHFSFYDLLEHVAKTRSLAAGTIIGSGTVSNVDETKGSSCIVEKRMLEKIHNGQITSTYLKENDVVKIQMFDKNGNNLFGTIKQKVSKYLGAKE